MLVIRILQGDARKVLPTLESSSVHCVVTSPPYFGLRDYGMDEQIGLENNPDAYIDSLLDVFKEIRRVLHDDGTLWVNVGDSYASDQKGTGGTSKKQTTNAGSFYKARKFNHGVKPKDLMGIPWLIAFALREQGWYLRQDIIWHKPNAMCESVRDRWEIPVQTFHGAHFATFPKQLVATCIKAGCPDGGIVLDPFFGSGTTGSVCRDLDRSCIGIELNPDYVKLAETRLAGFESRQSMIASKIKYEEELW